MPTATLVVIVNYRTGPLVIDCLRSLAPEVAAAGRFGPVRVVITDNGSSDDSPAQIEKAISDNGWNEWAHLEPLGRNGGFAWGNNAAIRPALSSANPPTYFWLLNPDTTVREGGLVALLEFMQANSRAGIAGSRLEDPDGTPQRSVFRFPSVGGELDNGLRLGLASRLLASRVVAPEPPEEACRAQWLSGASLLVRSEVFEAIGLLDERYFMYFEETDLCKRASNAGWECWYVPQSRVVHLVGQAGSVSPQQPRRRRPDYWFESRRRYFLKHLGRTRTLLADALFMAAFALWRGRRRLQGKPDTDPAHFLGDFARHSVWRRGFRMN
jgi:GT2 family glycosyltransferase